MKLSLRLPPHYHLRSVILSHGWSALEPFRVMPRRDGLSVAIRMSTGKPVVLLCTQTGRRLQIKAEGTDAVTEGEREEIRGMVAAMFRTDENLDGLYAWARRKKRLSWILAVGAGRILRAPTAFEDTVKMICTTNCSWSLTTLMVGRLTNSLGTAIGDRHTFPSAADMANQTERFYRREIKAGYRSPYLLELARRVAYGDLHIERVRNGELAEQEKIDLFANIMGVGPYALGNLLRLHSVYDRYAHDSWITAEYAKRYHDGRKVSERTIERRYEAFSPYQGLIYWLDMTKPWYRKKHDFDSDLTS